MGYLIIDNRVAEGPTGLQEYDTKSCVHCQKILKIVKGATEGNFCMPCMGPVCDPCMGKGVCEPSKRRYLSFMAKIERAMHRQQFFDRINRQPT